MNTEAGSSRPGRLRLIAARVLTLLAVLVAFVGMLVALAMAILVHPVAAAADPDRDELEAFDEAELAFAE